MSDLTPDRFPEFFQAVRGFEPFEWQQDLVEMLAEGTIPDAIDVPTGLGKTSVVDAWLFALAAQEPTDRKVPLRLLFVVDRKIVVDSTFDEAIRLSDRLTASSAEVIGLVAKLLTRYSGEAPLDVRRMRGGTTWDSRWLRRPDSPALITSTVDQFGSRLLFRGYGVSAGMRPIDAALVGTDTWVVLDEAHIAEPLAATVGRVSRFQSHGLLTSRAMRFTQMSATASHSPTALAADFGRQMTSARFPRSAAQARKRLEAEKPVGLIDLSWLTSKTKRRDSNQRLGEALAKIVEARAARGQVAAIVCNTIASARAAHQHLIGRGVDAVLLTGRCRAYEREEIVKHSLDPFRVGAPRDESRTRVLVATQTIEVGANLDFDFIVTESAPLASLVQRFGRVNRLGERATATSYVVHAAFFHDSDPIYGEANQRTWEWLVAQDSEPADYANEKEIAKAWPGSTLNFGITAFQASYRAVAETLRTPPPLTPVALAPHFERWSHTRPAPLPDQPVAPFLHGDGPAAPDVSVAWRAVPESMPQDPETWQQWIDLVPPVDWEFVEVPIWELQALLSQSAPILPTSDVEGLQELAEVEGVQVLTEAEPAGQASEPWGVVYGGADALPVLIHSVSNVKPGDRVILRSDVGGHDKWGWTGRSDSRPIADVADLAPRRRGMVFRVLPEVAISWGLDPEPLKDLIDGWRMEGPSEFEQAISLTPGYETAVDGGFRAYSIPGPIHELSGYLVRLTPRSPQALAPLTDTASDEDEVTTSLLGVALSLEQHGAEVGATAAEFATNLGLPPSIIEAVALAGKLHDVGKADPRFQVSLHLGDELAARTGEMLAKSGIDPRHPVARRAARVARLPDGFRHEARSEHLAKALIGNENAGLDTGLVLHLIASHHGWARPIMRPVEDRESPAISGDLNGVRLEAEPLLSQVDWTHPDRFRSLNDRYGIWSLALLETIVRLADMLCSEARVR